MSTAVYINGEVCELAYNEDLLLPSSECNVGISLGVTLNFWVLRIEFTNTIPTGARELTSYQRIENQGRTLVITFYKWYGINLENEGYHYFESKSKNVRAYVKVRTSAYINDLNRRSAHICIWKGKQKR